MSMNQERPTPPGERARMYRIYYVGEWTPEIGKDAKTGHILHAEYHQDVFAYSKEGAMELLRKDFSMKFGGMEYAITYIEVL